MNTPSFAHPRLTWHGRAALASAAQRAVLAGALGLACEPPASNPPAMASRPPRSERDEAVEGGAPGAPGAPSVWAPARKSFVGTSAADGANVYFTGVRGAVSEIYYPSLDRVQTLALELLVGDARGRFVDAEGQGAYVAERPEPHSLRWRVTTESAEHGWRLTKEVFADPERDALIVHGELEALGGDVGQLRLYVRHDPALGNSGAGDSSQALEEEGLTLLVASEAEQASALGASLPWARAGRGGQEMVSSGFAGVSDAAVDLADGRMDHHHRAARGGNVEQLGQIELGSGTSRQSFTLVLAFGATERDAARTARDVLEDDPAALARDYDAGWRAYVSGLSDLGGAADDTSRLAAMVLRTFRDKRSGAMIAGMGTPWGPSRGDDEDGGYHLVWPRDLFKFGNALITAGDWEAARGALDYLFHTLVQTSDCGESEEDADGCPGGYSRAGRFPQNAWIDGTPYWKSTQLDEQAMPLLLAARLHRLGNTEQRRSIEAMWPRMRPTAEYILSTGPWTPQERWEESSGYSPSTLAAEIAGLVVAASFALAHGDVEAAARYLTVADYWEENVEAWTFTTTGPHGNGRYHLRLNVSEPGGQRSGLGRRDPATGPDEPLPFTISNGGGTHDQRAIVDAGFLELVRLGVRGAEHWAIIDSLPEVDAILRQRLDDRGEGWFRYNFDGYGETNAGDGWDGDSGRGRLWPILTAERGIYEVARQRSGAGGEPHLPMLRAFATPEGFIPEQVWNETATISGWQVTAPAPFVPGTPTGSIAPLGWAMGEYISLLASVQAGAIVDLPVLVCRRYDTCEVAPEAGQVTLLLDISAPAEPGERIYVTTARDRAPSLGAPAQRMAGGRWRVVLEATANERVEPRLHRRSVDGSFTSERLHERRVLRAPLAGRATYLLAGTF